MIYEVRYARLDEAKLVEDFLRKYWNPNHILCNHRSILDFQHKFEDHYSIIIGYNTVTKEIDGLFCIIPLCRYDRLLQENGNFWSALLKIRDDVVNSEIKHLFYDFMLFICDRPHFSSFGAISLSSKAQSAMNLLFNEFGTMNQYYFGNHNKKDFSVCFNPVLSPITKSDECEIKEISFDVISSSSIEYAYYPQKSIEFLKNRYYNHPVYKYRYFGVYSNNELVCVWVCRKQEVLGSSILRIVDVYGDLSKVGYVGNSLQSILEKEDAEYVDFMNFGIDETVFSGMGFERLNVAGNETIVPNYFEPYEQRNVPIYFALITEKPYVIFKADGDQDRPSKI